MFGSRKGMTSFIMLFIGAAVGVILLSQVLAPEVATAKANTTNFDAGSRAMLGLIPLLAAVGIAMQFI